MLFRKAFLSVPDGLVEITSNYLWFYFSKYSWKVNSSNLKKDMIDRNHKRFVQLRITEGIPSQSKSIQVLKGRYVSSFSPYIYSYYHYLSELIDTVALNPGVSVLVSKNTPTKFIEFLNLCNISTLELELGVYRIDELIVPEYINLEWNESRLLRVRNFINNNIPNKQPSKFSFDRIYISRKKAKNRHLINENDIEDLLNSYSFKIIFLEEYSIVDQINIFRNCSIVMGPHGAGLTNSIFMKKFCKVIEIRPVLESGNFCFDNLSKLAFLEHTVLVSKNRGKFLVDKNSLKRKLQKL